MCTRMVFCYPGAARDYKNEPFNLIPQCGLLHNAFHLAYHSKMQPSNIVQSLNYVREKKKLGYGLWSYSKSLEEYAVLHWE